LKKRLLHFITLFVILLGAMHASAQQAVLSVKANEEMLGILDSATLKLRNKLYATPDAGDLNIYGFDPGDVPIYNDSAYAYRLHLLESEIPMDYNEFVRPYIDLYTVKRRKLTSKMLSLSTYYFPIFEEILDREGMPQELKYLAVIESALNPNAVSRVGAAGMWQFMRATGRMYGLNYSNAYDERRDVMKATEAAIKYLRNSYRIYGDWLLVIASYNCGPGNVNKAIKRAGNVKNFWAIQKYLPAETRGYVPAFIAAAYAMSYASEHNIYPATDLAVENHTDTVYIDNRYNLRTLATLLDMDMEQIRLMNPALKQGVIPFYQGKIPVTLPYSKAMLLTSMLATPDFKPVTDYMLAERKQSPDYIIHKVKRGESLSSIARKYGIDSRDIKSWNKLSGNKLATGKQLKIQKRG
jgi:membrane-bound lytic murein transglycosylase D